MPLIINKIEKYSNNTLISYKKNMGWRRINAVDKTIYNQKGVK